MVRFHPADVADSEPADQNSTGPRTFDFLGFTHYWGRSLTGRMGGQAQDGEEPIEASASRALGLVPAEPAPTDREINTRRSSRSCKATTRTMGSPVTSPVSRSSWRKRERSGDTGSRGAAAMARSPGRTSFDWSNVTAYPDREWSTACCAAQRTRSTRPRRNRINPRVIKRKMSKWKKKRPEHRHRPPLTKAFPDTVVMTR